MQKVFLTMYSIYCFILIDSLLKNPILNFQHTIFYIFYFFVLFVFYLVHIIQNREKKIVITKSEIVIIGFIIIYLIGFLNNSSSIYEILTSLLFVCILYINAKWIVRLRCVKEFILCSYFIPAITVTYLSSMYDIRFWNYWYRINFETIFGGGNRYRIDYGFYNVNGIGNICGFLIILSTIVFGLILHYSKVKRLLFQIGIIGYDLYLLGILLSTNTRTAIISVLLYIMLSLYFIFFHGKMFTKIYMKVFRFVFCMLTITIGFFLIFENIYGMFESSNRINSFLGNLKLVKTINEVLFGIGVLDSSTLRHLSGHTIDNYYIYIYITSGLIGLLIIAVILAEFGKCLVGHIKFNKSNKYLYQIFACYIVQLLEGFAETCVIYRIFPSSMILISICWGLLGDKKGYKKR